MSCQRIMVHELGRLEFRGQPERATLAALNQSAPPGWEEYLSDGVHSPRRAGSEPPTRVRATTRLTSRQRLVCARTIHQHGMPYLCVTQVREDDDRRSVQQERRRAEAETDAERERQRQRQEEHDRERRRREEEAAAARQQSQQATTADIFDMDVRFA